MLRLNITPSLDGFVAGPDRRRGGASARPKLGQLWVVEASGVAHIRHAVTR